MNTWNLKRQESNIRQCQRQVSWRPASRIPDSDTARSPGGPPHEYPRVAAPGLPEARLTNIRPYTAATIVFVFWAGLGFHISLTWQMYVDPSPLDS